MRLNLKYIVEDVDRHGNVRVYYRPPGSKKYRLREQPGTPEFLRELERAKKEAAKPVAAKRTKRQVRPSSIPGTLAHAATGYFASPEFTSLDEATRSQRRRLLGLLCEEHGQKRIRQMLPRHVRAIRDARADTPGAVNNVIKSLRALVKWALDRDLIDSNPATGISKLKPKRQGGFPPWTMDDVEIYRRKHPLGTTPRLAMELLLATGLRRSDAVRVGRQHVERFDGQDWIVMTAHKNRNSHPVRVEIPISPDLAAAIDAGPTGDLAFLVTEYGNPFSDKAFTGRMRSWTTAAGLQDALRMVCANCEAHCSLKRVPLKRRSPPRWSHRS